ncbi:MAG: hypothetical protein ACE5EG_04395, partial [Thermoanaerobaculia bacterium]
MRRRLRLLSGAAAVWIALTGAAGGEDLDLRQVCDAYSALTLIGVDTADGVALFAMSSRQDEIPGWIVELRAMDGVARLYPDWRERRRLGGSVGPGAVLVFGRCGSGCLQLMSWGEGGWQEIGEPLAAASSATAYPTRDGDGVPWVVLHRPTDESGVVLAEAYRLSGGEWSPQGKLPVTAVGSPAAAPAAGAGVLTGSGRFVEGLAPSSWVTGLPGLPARERGQLVPLPADEVAYLARDGRLYLSLDRGAGWTANQWLPWGGDGSLSAAEPTWSVDLPATDRQAPLSVAFFDNRGPELPELYLAERPTGGPWRVVSRLPASERIEREEIGYSHLLRLANGRWLLLAQREQVHKHFG